MLQRKIYSELIKWKTLDQGKSAMLIDGARRVGKSYIAREFAMREYKSFILIDFANVSDEIRDIFNNETSDLDLFFNKLSAYKDVMVKDGIIHLPLYMAMFL